MTNTPALKLGDRVKGRFTSPLPSQVDLQKVFNLDVDTGVMPCVKLVTPHRKTNAVSPLSS